MNGAANVTIEELKKVLIASIKKNGNRPLTLQHLVNIIEYVEKEKEAVEKQFEVDTRDLLNPNL